MSSVYAAQPAYTWHWSSASQARPQPNAGSSGQGATTISSGSQTAPTQGTASSAGYLGHYVNTSA
ncbi:MAG TPA: hypothetical protein VGB82_16225 [Alphaproteobacteria bacterium]